MHWLLNTAMSESGKVWDITISMEMGPKECPLLNSSFVCIVDSGVDTTKMTEEVDYHPECELPKEYWNPPTFYPRSSQSGRYGKGMKRLLLLTSLEALEVEALLKRSLNDSAFCSNDNNDTIREECKKLPYHPKECKKEYNIHIHYFDMWQRNKRLCGKNEEVTSRRVRAHYFKEAEGDEEDPKPSLLHSPVNTLDYKEGNGENHLFRATLGEEHRPLEELVRNHVQEDEFDALQTLWSIYFDCFNLEGLCPWEKIWEYKKSEQLF